MTVFRPSITTFLLAVNTIDWMLRPRQDFDPTQLSPPSFHEAEFGKKKPKIEIMSGKHFHL